MFVGQLIPGSPAEMCGQLQLYDELLMVNDVEVSQMDHWDIVQLMKDSSTSIKLLVQQPDGQCSQCTASDSVSVCNSCRQR